MINKPLSEYTNEGLLDALVAIANRVNIPEESNFLSDVKAELLARLTMRAADMAGTRPDNAEPGIQVSGRTVDGEQLPPCR